MAILEARGLCKRFGDFVAVDGVSLAFEEGSVTSIIGPNGAGKTTLVNLLTGRLEPDAGQVLLRGQDITRWPPQERVRAGLARSFQITSVFGGLTVADSLAIPVMARAGVAWRRGGSPWEHAEVRRAVEGLLAGMGLADVAQQPAAALAYGKRRLLEIALVMASEPAVVALDEPTAGLTTPERLELLELLRRLAREHGKTLILVEHDMDMVFAVSDRIVVLHRGRVLADGPPDAIRRDPEVRAVYLGASLDREEPTTDDEIGQAQPGAGERQAEPLLEATGLHVYYGPSHVIQGASLTVGVGERVLLMGRNGAGKSTLMKALAGVTPPRRGRVLWAGREVTGWPAHRIARAGIAYVPDDRRIFGDLTVLDNLLLGAHALGARPSRWTPERLMELFPNLREAAHRPARQLSGGEQKMLAIARGLMGSPSLLLLDEPSEGLAPRIVEAMAWALEAIGGEGVSLLVADQNVRFAQRLGGWAYILEKGRIQAEGPVHLLLRDTSLVARYLAV